MATYEYLPDDLPIPVDDGAADHLCGMPLPKLTLVGTDGLSVELSALGEGRTVLYLYPLSGKPGSICQTAGTRSRGAGCTRKRADSATISRSSATRAQNASTASPPKTATIRPDSLSDCRCRLRSFPITTAAR